MGEVYYKHHRRRPQKGYRRTHDKKLLLLMAILENFAKRELGERMKARDKKAKSGKKESE